MALKKVISGSQVLMTDDNRLYLKKKKNGVVFFKELTPTLQNEYLSCYTVPLSGRREMMQHLFLVAKDNGKIVADFIEYGFMIPFLLGKELLMVNCLLTGNLSSVFPMLMCGAGLKANNAVSKSRQIYLPLKFLVRR